VYGGGAARHGAAGALASAMSRHGNKTNSTGRGKTPKIATKVLKIVDLTTLYNFYKGSRVFFSTDFAQSAAKL
jgi:hypothetical protein